MWNAVLWKLARKLFASFFGFVMSVIHDTPKSMVLIPETVREVLLFVRRTAYSNCQTTWPQPVLNEHPERFPDISATASHVNGQLKLQSSVQRTIAHTKVSVSHRNGIPRHSANSSTTVDWPCHLSRLLPLRKALRLRTPRNSTGPATFHWTSVSAASSAPSPPPRFENHIDPAPNSEQLTASRTPTNGGLRQRLQHTATPHWPRVLCARHRGSFITLNTKGDRGGRATGRV